MKTELPISKMSFCCLFTLQVLKQSQDISGHIILKKHQNSFIFCLADSHFSMGGGGIVYSVSTQTPHLPPRSSDIFCPQGKQKHLSSMSLEKDKWNKQGETQPKAHGCAWDAVWNKTFISFLILLNLSPQSLIYPLQYNMLRALQMVSGGVCRSYHLQKCSHSHQPWEPLDGQQPFLVASHSSMPTR